MTVVATPPTGDHMSPVQSPAQGPQHAMEVDAERIGYPPTYAESNATDARSVASESLYNASAAGDEFPPKYATEGSSSSGRGKGKAVGSITSTFHKLSTKAGWPLNKAANVIGAEGWWPTSGEKECGKAARILHSFTSVGVAAPPTAGGPMHATGLTKKSLVKIPDAVLRNCAGLAIFNVIRAGAFHGSLAAGSGLVVARRADGSWSPPSTFVVSTVGAGFVIGLDVYDCVCVLNTREQVQAFTNPRVSLGGAMSIAIGPLGAGGSVDAAASKTVRPVWSYMKSRGLWAGVQIDGTIMVSRGDANAVFYQQKGISAKQILEGNVEWPEKAKPLFEVLKAMEGRADYDRTVVQEVGSLPPPGDTILDEKAAVGQVNTEVVGNMEGGYRDEPAEPQGQESAEAEKERLRQTGY